MEPSVSSSLLAVKISFNSPAPSIFDVNGKNELINGIFRMYSSVWAAADAADEGTSCDRICKSCCSFEILLMVIRLKRSICGVPPFLISSTGSQR